MGIVYFVGAGPGDAGLISAKGLEKLSICDAVIYDRLAPKELLGFTRDNCELIYVGKTPGAQSKTQEEINEILVDRALSNKIAVRLKGGDSFVFGRCVEEMEALKRRGIPYEAIPGVTSAVAVPECSGIPPTCRAVSRSFHVIAGHTNDETGAPDCDFESLAKLEGTLIFLMGLSNIKFIADQLIAHGMKKEVPAAVISDGCGQNRRTIRSDVGHIANEAKKNGIRPPAVIVIGDTASYDYTYHYEKGKKIGIVATRQLADKLSEELSRIGMKGVFLCEMEAVGTKDAGGLDAELKNIQNYGWIVFTSRNGVRFFFKEYNKSDIDIRKTAKIKFAAVGSGTAQELKKYGIHADFVPSSYNVETLAKELAPIIKKGEKALIPRSSMGSRLLTEAFAAKNIAYKEVHTYNVKGKLTDEVGRMDELGCVFFASESGVRAFFALIKKEGISPPDGAGLVCMGEPTKRALLDEFSRLGLRPDVAAARQSSVKGAVEAIALKCGQKKE